LATSINLRRPRQFPLHQMLWQDFEDLIRDVGFEILGAALSPFKEGPDGGRDARFDGVPNAWPSEQGQEKGQYVLQCKHTKRAGACCSEEDFKRLLRKEVPKVKTLIAAKELSHYMVFTNRTKPAEQDVAFRTRFGKIVGLSKSWLLGIGELSLLLRAHPEIWDRYEEEIRNPIRFNRDDLIEIIRDFAKFMTRADGQHQVQTLRHLRLEDKNRVNGISKAYFDDMQRHTMPQFEHIRSFLENPRNEKDLNLYQDTADDLRGRLRAMLDKKEVSSLEQGMDQIRDQFITSDPRFKGKRRWVRTFIDYMYSTCEIGQNADPAQAPKT
jgi:ABC-3C protein